MQPYELYSQVMDPLKRELDKFLKKDPENPEIFKHVLITKQMRSKSVDQAEEYEMGEDEVPGKQES